MNGIVNTINNLFNNPELRSTLVAYRLPLAIAFTIALLFFMKPEYFWLGFLISLIGEGLQIWCFASISKNKELSTKGPYAVMRNPMYIGRYLLILGAIIITGSWILVLVFSIIYYFYMVNRVKREENVLAEVFGLDYEAYCKRINRFMPSLGSINLKDIAHFRFDLFLKNHAHLNLISVLAGYAAAYLILLYGKEFLNF